MKTAVKKHAQNIPLRIEYPPSAPPTEGNINHVQTGLGLAVHTHTPPRQPHPETKHWAAQIENLQRKMGDLAGIQGALSESDAGKTQHRLKVLAAQLVNGADVPPTVAEGVFKGLMLVNIAKVIEAPDFDLKAFAARMKQKGLVVPKEMTFGRDAAAMQFVLANADKILGKANRGTGRNHTREVALAMLRFGKLGGQLGTREASLQSVTDHVVEFRKALPTDANGRKLMTDAQILRLLRRAHVIEIESAAGDKPFWDKIKADQDALDAALDSAPNPIEAEVALAHNFLGNEFNTLTNDDLRGLYRFAFMAKLTPSDLATFADGKNKHLSAFSKLRLHGTNFGRVVHELCEAHGPEGAMKTLVRWAGAFDGIIRIDASKARNAKHFGMRKAIRASVISGEEELLISVPPADLPRLKSGATQGNSTSSASVRKNSVHESLKSISQLLLEQPIIAKGLAFPFSPNHLTTSTDVARWQLEMLQHLNKRDWTAVHAMVENTAVKETRLSLYTTENAVREFFEPMVESLSDHDWKMLALLACFHDVGRVNRAWAMRNNLNADALEGLAHDLEGRRFLEDNPQLLEAFGLSNEESALLKELVAWHTVPGQSFFGEGDFGGYESALKASNIRKSSAPIDASRIHGLVDVMSALAKRFVAPIVKSHQSLRDTLTEAYELRASLREAFDAQAGSGTTAKWREVAKSYGLSITASYRLMLLTGLKTAEDSAALEEALSKLDPSFIRAFDASTDSDTTWFGTYIAMGFGSGMIRSGTAPAEAIEAIIKIVAIANKFHQTLSTSSFSLSAKEVSKASPARLRDALKSLNTVDQGVQTLQNANEGLSLRGNAEAVEISYRSPLKRPEPNSIAAIKNDTLEGALKTVVAIEKPENRLLLERIEDLRRRAGTPGDTNPLRVEQLMAGSVLLNSADEKELMKLPGISSELADAIVAKRHSGLVFEKVRDLNQIPGMSEESIACFEAYEKLAQIVTSDFSGANEVMQCFFSDLGLHLAKPESKDRSLREVFLDVVAARPEQYVLKGEPAPVFKLDATRTVDTWPLYEFHFDLETKAYLKARYGIDNASSFEKKAAQDPLLLRELLLDENGNIKRKLLKGVISGARGVGWWGPGGAKAGSLAEVIKARGLIPDRYMAGLILVSLDLDFAYRQDFRVPTAFDGMGFDEWKPAPEGVFLGETSGEVYEVVTGPIQIRDVTDIQMFLPG